MAKTALVILADGFEEIEAITPIDLLRRAGVEVTVAGLDKKILTGRNQIQVQADVELSAYRGKPDAVVLPGGAQGASNLSHSETVQEILREAQADGRWIAAICAAPAVVLGRHGFLDGKEATCYPGFEKNFSSNIRFSSDRVVIDGRVITSRAPGTAIEFSIELIRQLVGPDKANEILNQTLAKI